MENLTNNKETIAIILSMIIPGAGLIYLGKEHKFEGVKISILFVIVSFVSLNIVKPLLFGLLRLGPIEDLIVPPILFLPIFIIWFIQLTKVLKITKEIEMKSPKN